MIPHNQIKLTPEDEYAVAGVVRSGQIGPGPHVMFFEDELAERFRPDGAAICVSSGTAALRLVIEALGLDKIALPTYSCVALYHAAVAAGIRNIRLVDCAPWTLCSRAASVVVHTYGTPSAVLGQIEDFTHAPGGEYQRIPCGSMGMASVISFGATKPLGCGGGGAVLGPPELIEEIRDRRDYDGKSQLRERFNWEMSEFHAAIGRKRLERLDAENAWRSATAERYSEICRANGVQIYGASDSTAYRFVVFVKDVVRAVTWFAERGVEAICPLRTDELLHRQLGINEEHFPFAEDAALHTVSLPIWPGMEPADVWRVLTALRQMERQSP